MQQDEMAHGEIIIVRRGNGGHEEEHHGGVWKIAFADFMTAMMAFFLVMWLINASNEKTKKAVASYFNPIKLTDTTTNSKGVQNPKYGLDDKNEVKNEETVAISTPAKIEIKLATKEKKFEEQALFVDPYAILAEISGGLGKDDGEEQKVSTNDANQGAGLSLNDGSSFQDPFDPNTWDNNREATPQNNVAELSSDEEQAIGNSGLETGMLNTEGSNFKEVDEGDLIQTPKQKLEEQAEQQIAEKLEDKKEDKKEDHKAETEDQMEVASINEAESEASEKVTEMTKAINDLVKATVNENELSGLNLEVTSNDQGTIVVLSDKNQNGMFTIGSAKPTKALVTTMEKLGKIITKQDGLVEISGHTDARKYQSEDYDNWRLSTARAHMAYYMLVRGGMEESQVEKIVGQAAVRLKVPDQPNSAANRRIEIAIKPK